MQITQAISLTHSHTHAKQSHCGEGCCCIYCIMSVKSHCSHAAEDEEGGFICSGVTVVSQWAALCKVAVPLWRLLGACLSGARWDRYPPSQQQTIDEYMSWGLKVKWGPSNLVFRQSDRAQTALLRVSTYCTPQCPPEFTLDVTVTGFCNTLFLLTEEQPDPFLSHLKIPLFLYFERLKPKHT